MVRSSRPCLTSLICFLLSCKIVSVLQHASIRFHSKAGSPAEVGGERGSILPGMAVPWTFSFLPGAPTRDAGAERHVGTTAQATAGTCRACVRQIDHRIRASPAQVAFSCGLLAVRFLETRCECGSVADDCLHLGC